MSVIELRAPTAAEEEQDDFCPIPQAALCSAEGTTLTPFKHMTPTGVGSWEVNFYIDFYGCYTGCIIRFSEHVQGSRYRLDGHVVEPNDTVLLWFNEERA